MNVYPWTLGSVETFEMRVVPNAMTFTSPYSKSTQTIDFLGERWSVKMDIPALVDKRIGAAREAFFDRLRGPVNLVSIWNIQRPVPQGTFRDGAVGADIPQLSNTGLFFVQPGATFYAGDHFSINGQLMRVMADAASDNQGNATVEFLPRARALIPAATPIVWLKPTANFRLNGDGAPTVWRMGSFDGTSLEFTETY